MNVRWVNDGRTDGRLEAKVLLLNLKKLITYRVFRKKHKQPSAGEGEVAKFREFLEKNTILNEHPVPDRSRSSGAGTPPLGGSSRTDYT